MTLAKLAERYGVEAAAITVKDGVASFTKDGKQYQVGYSSQLKIETVLTTEGTVTTDADQAELLEKIQQMRKGSAGWRNSGCGRLPGNDLDLEG